MGCGNSGMRDRFQEGMVPMRKFMGRMTITEDDLWPLFKQFDKCDGDHSGEINFDEFCDHFHLEWSEFGEKAFMVMEVGGDHKLSFSEFTVGMMNYCTSEHEGLVRFAFDMFDGDHSGHIDKLELKKLMRMAQGGKRQKQAYYDDMMRKIDTDRDGDITWAEFRTFEKKMPSLLQEPFHLQKNLQNKVCGMKYWKKFTKKRKEKCPKVDLIALHHKLETGADLDRQELKRKATKRGHGMIEWDKGRQGKSVSVYDNFSKNANKVGTCKFKESIEIFEKMHVEKEGTFFKIAEKEEKWVEAKYVTIDHRWDKVAKEQDAMKQQKLDEDAMAAKRESEREARLEQARKEWKECIDKESGKKYWYNMNTSETTWNNPFK